MDLSIPRSALVTYSLREKIEKNRTRNSKNFASVPVFKVCLRFDFILFNFARSNFPHSFEFICLFAGKIARVRCTSLSVCLSVARWIRSRDSKCSKLSPETAQSLGCILHERNAKTLRERVSSQRWRLSVRAFAQLISVRNSVSRPNLTISRRQAEVLNHAKSVIKPQSSNLRARVNWAVYAEFPHLLVASRHRRADDQDIANIHFLHESRLRETIRCPLRIELSGNSLSG